ncbi:MAG: DNA internalization-related competence protein ComEC/Rec2 [Bacillaceae bacterium]|nr:DNA internalization-related competence protein ComEC/Rec2 [Bacillaceae bacterium]
MNRPFAEFAAAFGGGMLLAGLVTAMVFRAGIFLFLITFTLMTFLTYRHFPRLWVTGLMIVAGYLFYTGYDMMNHSRLSQILWSGEEADHGQEKEWAGEVRGILVSPPEVNGDRVRFVLEVDAIRRDQWERVSEEKVQVTLRLKSSREKQRVSGWHRGDRIRTGITLHPPPAPSNPGAFDYPRYLYYQHIHLMGRIDGLQAISIEEQANGGMAVADRLQGYLSQKMDQIFQERTAPVFKGLLLGDKQDIPHEVKEAFSRLGLGHVLAISGLHVGILISLLLGGGRLMGFTFEHTIRFTLVVLPLYAVLTGLTPSVIRAVLMGEVALVAWLIRRTRDPWNTLGFAFVVMVLFEPYYLWQIGFQLSFLVTGGLFYLVPFLSKTLPVSWTWLRNLLAVTLAAQLVSFPLTIYYFHQYSLLSFLTNLVFVPIIAGIFVPVGLSAFLLGLMHPALTFLVSGLLEYGWRGIERLLLVVANWNQVHWSWAPPPIAWMVLYGLALFLWVSRVSQREDKGRRGWQLIPLILLIGLIAYAWHPVPQQEGVEITFLDVGQGDSAVIRFPDNRVYVIDGGGNPSFFQEKATWKTRNPEFDPGRDIIAPFLRYHGISRIDTLVMSHGDLDHIGGFYEMIRLFPVRQVIGNGMSPGSETEQKIITRIRDRSIPLLRGTSGAGWKIDDRIRVTLLSPLSRKDFQSGLKQTDNNASVVMLLEAYGRSILFTGDLEKEGEQALISEWKQQGLNRDIDVLKVAHHGSRTSTSKEWLDWIRPNYAIISVGAFNFYGHPADEVIERLVQSDVRVFRTDRDGAITIFIDPSGNMDITRMK